MKHDDVVFVIKKMDKTKQTMFKDYFEHLKLTEVTRTTVDLMADRKVVSDDHG